MSFMEEEHEDGDGWLEGQAPNTLVDMTHHSSLGEIEIQVIRLTLETRSVCFVMTHNASLMLLTSYGGRESNGANQFCVFD